MSDYVQAAGKAGDQYLAALAASQERYLEYMARWSRWMPRGTTTRFGGPGLAELSKSMFAFYEQVLDQQKACVEKLLTPVAVRQAISSMASSPSPSPSARSGAKGTGAKRQAVRKARSKKALAKKTVAKKTVAKKTVAKKAGAKKSASKSAGTSESKSR